MNFEICIWKRTQQQIKKQPKKWSNNKQPQNHGSESVLWYVLQTAWVNKQKKQQINKIWLL